MAISKSHRARRSSCKVVPGRCCTGNRLTNPLALLFVTLASVSMLAPCSALPFESTTLPADVEEIANQNETTVAPAIQDVAIDPVETKASEVVDELVDTSFVSLGGEDLEQDIRNAVKSEMELEMEADASSPVVPLKEEPAQGQANETDHQETEVESVREPKTLEAEEEAPKAEPSNPQANNEQSQETQQTNTQTDSDAGPTRLVSSGEEEEEDESQSRPLPSVTSDVVSVIFNENRAITEQPITKTNLLALEQEHEAFEDRETTPLPIYEGPKHQVTKKQGVEDLLPIEVAPEVEPEPEIASQEAKTVREERTLEEQKDSLNEIDTEEIEPKAISTVHVEPAHAELETEAEVEARAETAARAELEAQVEESSPPEDTIVEPAEPQEAAEEIATEETATESVINNEEQTEEEEVVVAHTEQNETTEGQQLVDSAANHDSHNIEDESNEGQEVDSDEAEAKTEQPKDASDSSEEEKESAGDEAKSPSDDSTATPLVSYPPHDADQTFDSNSADEHSAPLSRPSSYRSTMIIALCSGTAVIFIITSLVIFVVSFQRQHGTLDIEMQEQRLGKDSLDEEDAQMKLLDVDLSTPVIVSMGSEETDECL
ncbi:retinitis pigmentosa 1-like 1 protein [Drosophila guanche]|uniref:Uncharacterized protein n=1 Tax=Drosophila guanche TaxID=7266 RepID=A0A3B0KRE3_DROGU|nr:retinitis pigmentosa 1-like 1 protein [Drosophila guanche]SPP87811.1 Hypothetical predicted protein [Drosophila guanche]